MALVSGTRLDHYEILSAIGAGGMGEVYRARDTRLGRDVACKVLPDAFAGDPDRLARFQREAHLLAALNHSNIAHIYGIVESGETHCIVMELVEGETLQARLRRGPVPVDEALQIASQVAEALEAAHDRGILHRDLKPGNIMWTAEGKVKVLDFGLAKAMESPAADANLSQSPTMMTIGQSQANVLIGTAAYMSPEQLRGHNADGRSDIWAFGVVLYEMLTGRQAFSGETLTDLISGIVRIEPDWNALPASVPAPVVALLKRCLQKDRRRRFHAIGDFRIELEEALSAPVAPATPVRQNRERTAWVIAAVLALVMMAILIRVTWFAPATAQPLTSRFLIEFPEGGLLLSGAGAPWPSISPDGRYVTFVAVSGGVARLWLRPIGSLAPQALPGTEGVGADPFWSADSRFIAFFAAGKLKKISVAGGPPQILCAADPGGNSYGGAWNQDDVILFAHQGAIHRVSAGGGASGAIRTPDKSRNEVSDTLPSFLPDGRHFLYVAVNSQEGRTEVRAGSLNSVADDKPLFPGYSRVQYAHPNHLLFTRDGTLMAQPFDASKLSLSGDAFPVAEQVAYSSATGNAAFSVSDNGTLVYRTRTAGAATELTWFDRSGKKLGVVPAAGNFINPRLSPDQTHLAVAKVENGLSDIWIIDLVRGTSSRLTFDPASDVYPAFSPDGKQVVFLRTGPNDIYVKAASGVGAEELIVKTAGNPSDWSPDGKIFLFGHSAETSQDLWAVPMIGEHKPYPVLNQKYNEARARFSPDGRWILYSSNETNRFEIYVQTFPPSGGKWQVSVDGAIYAYWRSDSKEIAFDSSDGRIMTVDVKLGATFEAGVPRELFKIPGTIAGGKWAATSDLQKFLIPLAPESGDRPTLTVVSNWAAEIKK